LREQPDKLAADASKTMQHFVVEPSFFRTQ